MISFLLIAFLLLILLLFSAYARSKSNDVDIFFVNYSNENNTNKFIVNEGGTSLDPTFQPYEEIFYKSSKIQSVFLPRWVEGFAHNVLVPFGPYLFGIRDNYLAVVDMNMGRHKINLFGDIRIIYADPMVIKISSKRFDVTLTRGSPFITIKDRANSIKNNIISSIVDSNGNDINTTIKSFKINEYIYNLLILPNIPSMLQLIEINKDVVVDKVEVSSEGSNLHWYTRGTGMLLLFIPNQLPSVAPETGIEVLTPLGNFKLIRGSVWIYEDIPNKEDLILPNPPHDIKDVRYDVESGRYIVLGNENDSYLYIASLSQKLIRENNLLLAYPLLRYLYGGGLDIERGSLFPLWYSVDFYQRTLPIIDLRNIRFVKTIESLFNNL